MEIQIDKSIHSPNFNTDSSRKTRFVVIHQTMGNFASDVMTLTDNRLPLKDRRSSHYLIDRDGKIYELVPPQFVAWHAGTKPVNQKNGPFRELWGFGNENTNSIGIEHVALENQPFTDAQRTSSAQLVAFLIKQFPAIVPDRLHIVAHSEISNVKIDPQLQVPGAAHNWDWDAFMASVNANLGNNGLPQVVVEPLPEGAQHFDGSAFFPQTHQFVSGGFLSLWEKPGNGLFVCGFPLTGEMQDDNLTVQYFENVRMEWNPGKQPRFGAVGRLYVQLAAPPAGVQSTDNPTFFAQTNQSVGGEFRGLFEKFGLFTCGFPLTGEIQEDGRTVQYFENVRMEKSPGSHARFGAVGRQYLNIIHTG